MTAASTAGDGRFFHRTGPHRLRDVAAAAGGTAPESELLLSGVAPLQSAGADQVSFLDNRKYAPALEATRAPVSSSSASSNESSAARRSGPSAAST